jgi:hypothetical protein
MPCLILGDSIALGLSTYFPQCEVRAQIGAGSAAIARRASGEYDWIVISAGSNDATHNSLAQATLAKHLYEMRQAVKGRVCWIAPYNYAAGRLVIMAMEPGDTIVNFRHGPDGIHPRSYKELAGQVKQLLRSRSPGSPYQCPTIRKPGDRDRKGIDNKA